MNTNLPIDQLIKDIEELQEYLYDWASSYLGMYSYIDHTNWNEICMKLFFDYKFNINKIKDDIKSGKIHLQHYSNPRAWMIENKLYEIHKARAEEYEKKMLAK